MSVRYTAAQCPAVMAPTVAYTKAAAYAGSDTPPVAQNMSSGGGAALSAKWNENAMQLDLTGRYGGGGYAIAKGLVISAPATGLNLNVAAGHALIDGVVEIAAATTLALPPNSGPVWVWLSYTGALSYTLNTTPPSAQCCLLGCAFTGGSTIFYVDFSGVVYLRGGTLWRETADAGEPDDTPSSALQFYTRTAGGLYYWDGTAYTQMGPDITSLSDTVDEQEDRIFTLEQQVAAIAQYLVGEGLDGVLEDPYVQLLFE